MVEVAAPAVGQWWRFNRYEIRNGIVCPAEDAVLEQYDPWSSYASGRMSSPWLSLFNLINRLGAHRRPSLTALLSPEGERLLLEWCSEHGLLGLLSHQTEEARLWPRYVPEEDVSDLVGYPMPDAHRIAQLRFIRRGGVWVQEYVDLGPIRAERPALRTREMAQVEPGDIPGHAFVGESPAYAARVDPVTEVFGRSPLSGTWSRYFPDIRDEERERFPYPLPLSEDFWRVYGEPVDEFLTVADLLRNSLAILGDFPSSADLTDEQIQRVGSEWFRLNQQYLIKVAPSLALRDDDWTMQWVGPSLLSYIAMMGAHELTQPRTLLKRCADCGQMFTTTRPTALYCSTTCRHRVQKRQQRKNRAAQESASQRGRNRG